MATKKPASPRSLYGKKPDRELYKKAGFASRGAFERSRRYPAKKK